MKNKKAILPEETLKLIIAALSILILVYLAVQLYGLLTKKTDLEQARQSLDQIVAKINDLKIKAEGTEDSYLVTSPKDWFVTYYETSNQYSPKECNSQSCLCFCSEVTSFLEKQILCRGNYVCKTVETSNLMFYSECTLSTVDNPVYAVKNCLSLKNIPVNSILKKESNNIGILTSESSFISSQFDALLIYKKEGDVKNIQSLISQFIQTNKNEDESALSKAILSFLDKQNLCGFFVINSVDSGKEEKQIFNTNKGCNSFVPPPYNLEKPITEGNKNYKLILNVMKNE